MYIFKLFSPWLQLNKLITFEKSDINIIDKMGCYPFMKLEIHKKFEKKTLKAK